VCWDGPCLLRHPLSAMSGTVFGEKCDLSAPALVSATVVGCCAAALASASHMFVVGCCAAVLASASHLFVVGLLCRIPWNSCTLAELRKCCCALLAHTTCTTAPQPLCDCNNSKLPLAWHPVALVDLLSFGDSLSCVPCQLVPSTLHLAPVLRLTSSWRAAHAAMHADPCGLPIGRQAISLLYYSLTMAITVHPGHASCEAY
jgi:hypothetical protein